MSTTVMASEIHASLDDYSDQNECEFVEESEPGAGVELPLRPAHRGTYRCPCLGEVVIMFGHYGWLTTEEWIDHAAASKNGGRIYVQSRDVVNGLTLVEGDKVAFYLYVDGWGLGAEAVHLQRWCLSAPAQAHLAPNREPLEEPLGRMNARAAEFVPCTSPLATAFPGFAHNPRPPTAMPSQVSMHPVCAAPVTMFVNAAYWSDDSDEDSEDEVCSVKSDRNCDGDVEDSYIPKAGAERRGPKATIRRFLKKPPVRSISHGSSSTSAGSDSEAQDITTVASLADAPVLMSLPPGLYPRDRALTPPPGLRHPDRKSVV